MPGNPTLNIKSNCLEKVIALFSLFFFYYVKKDK